MKPTESERNLTKLNENKQNLTKSSIYFQIFVTFWHKCIEITLGLTIMPSMSLIIAFHGMEENVTASSM